MRNCRVQWNEKFMYENGGRIYIYIYIYESMDAPRVEWEIHWRKMLVGSIKFMYENVV